jgi:hypothetical protein
MLLSLSRSTGRRAATSAGRYAGYAMRCYAMLWRTYLSLYYGHGLAAGNSPRGRSGVQEQRRPLHPRAVQQRVKGELDGTRAGWESVRGPLRFPRPPPHAARLLGAWCLACPPPRCPPPCLQHAAWHAAWHAAFSTQHSAFNTQHSTFNMVLQAPCRHITCSIGRAFH